MSQRKKSAGRVSNTPAVRQGKRSSHVDMSPRRGPVRKSSEAGNSSRRTISLVIIGAGVLVALWVLLASLAPRGGGQTASRPGQNVDQKGLNADVAALQQQINQNPNDVQALISMGNAYYDAGRWGDSIPWYSKALDVQADNTDVRTDMGTAYLYSGDPAKAKEQWDRVLELDPNKVEAHFNLGILYSNQTPPDNDNAAKHWETVLKIAPNSEQAKAAEQNLKKMGRR